jgi:flagellar L-ring protein precursor FlgH
MMKTNARANQAARSSRVTSRPARGIRTVLAAGCLAMAMTGCVLVSSLYKPNSKPAPKQAVAPEAKTAWKPASVSDGSLWSANAGSIFTDVKAYHPGDIVLVNVDQTNSGSKSANTGTSRDTSVSATVNHFFGLEDKINSLTGYTKDSGVKKSSSSWSPVPLVDASSSNSFTGKGSTDRSDSLTATVSAVVTEVLPNGNLVIYGHQAVTLNHECSMLTVQGIVRPADIAADNTVESNRLANADIQFTGSGVVSDKQHGGWATRALDWMLPF